MIDTTGDLILLIVMVTICLLTVIFLVIIGILAIKRQDKPKDSVTERKVDL